MSHRKATIHVLKRDVEKAQRLADEDQDLQGMVDEYAGVLTAMRRLQVAAGPGHKPLEAIAELLPKQYVRNWARELLQAA